MLGNGALSMERWNHAITLRLSDYGKYCRKKAINKPLPGGEESSSIDILAGLQCLQILFPCIHSLG